MNSVEEDIFPEGWDLVRLEELSNISIGKTPPRSNKELFLGNNIWLSIRDLKGDVVSVSNEKITDKAVISSNMKIISEGTLLMSFKLTLGRTAFAGCDLFTNEAIASLPIKDETVLNKYFLKYALATIDLEKEVDNAVKGKTLNKQKLKNLEIPFPKLEEQKRIVAKIDNLFAKIDKAISLTKESLKQAKNLLPSVLKEVFEKGKADGWEEKKLEEVCDVIGGGTPKTKISEYWDGEIVWLSPIDLPPIGEISMVRDSRKKITEIGLKKSSAKLLPKGSVVYSTRASIGKIAIAEIPLSTNQGFTNFICGEGLNNRYLCFCLKHFNKNIENLSNSTTFKEVSKSSVKEFEIPVPSIDSQMKVVKIADDVLLKSKQTQSKLEEQLAYLKQLKSSILSKAFKGEL